MLKLVVSSSVGPEKNSVVLFTILTPCGSVCILQPDRVKYHHNSFSKSLRLNS